MRRVDYINEEPVMCFPTPILDFNIIKCDKIELSTGDFVHFKDKSIVPISTYFYKYKENILILDYDREEPIAHIIKNSKVFKTIKVSDLSKEDFSYIKQVIDIYGKEIKINNINDIDLFHKEFIDFKQFKNNLYKESRSKLQELIESSDRMRSFDKVAGTTKVIDFITDENINLIKSSLPSTCKQRYNSTEEYKNMMREVNSFNAIVIISNLLERELYIDFKSKNKEHTRLLALANKASDELTNKFNNKWFVEEKYSKEKNLGALFDCSNEMLCSKKYLKDEVDFVDCLIAKKLDEDIDLLDSFIEWVDLCPVDKEEMRSTLLETLNEWCNKYNILLENKTC